LSRSSFSEFPKAFLGFAFFLQCSRHSSLLFPFLPIPLIALTVYSNPPLFLLSVQRRPLSLLSHYGQFPHFSFPFNNPAFTPPCFAPFFLESDVHDLLPSCEIGPPFSSPVIFPGDEARYVPPDSLSPFPLLNQQFFSSRCLPNSVNQRRLPLKSSYDHRLHFFPCPISLFFLCVPGASLFVPLLWRIRLIWRVRDLHPLNQTSQACSFGAATAFLFFSGPNRRRREDLSPPPPPSFYCFPYSRPLVEKQMIRSSFPQQCILGFSHFLA